MKRKNNQLIFYLEPFQKRVKYSLSQYIDNLQKTLEKINIQYDKKCKINFTVVDNKVISNLSIDDHNINPYFLDFY